MKKIAAIIPQMDQNERAGDRNDVERKLAGVLSVQSSFSRVLPDYLILKDEIRRIVPKDISPAVLH